MTAGPGRVQLGYRGEIPTLVECLFTEISMAEKNRLAVDLDDIIVSE